MSVLQASSMNYDWGKVGEASIVYKKLEDAGIKDLDKSKPYAELWMGDHEKAPCRLPNGKRLSEDEHFGPVSFLFKILSVKTPLSLQVHPERDLAEKLHNKDPKNYPDANPKPEMALFITDSMFLYGFREIHEIAHFMNTIHAFNELLPKELVEKFNKSPSNELYKELLFYILTKDQSHTLQKNEELLQKLDSYGLDKSIVDAVKIVDKYFHGDVGIFYPFILNVVIAPAGSVCYIPPGILHSYLSGDLYESMIQSDNVIRGGMTSKFIDIESLKDAVVFEPRQINYLEPTMVGPVKEYLPPYPEFCLKVLDIEAGAEKTFNIDTIHVLCVDKGHGYINETAVKEGQVVALPVGSIKVKADADLELVLCSSHFKKL